MVQRSKVMKAKEDRHPCPREKKRCLPFYFLFLYQELVPGLSLDCLCYSCEAKKGVNYVGLARLSVLNIFFAQCLSVNLVLTML